jgi:hypothetical protein
VERLEVFGMQKGVFLCMFLCMHGTSQNGIFAVLCIENTTAGRTQTTILQGTRQHNQRRNASAYVLSFALVDLVSSLQKRAFLYGAGSFSVPGSKEVA